MKHSIDITPDTSLLPKLGKSGYSIPQAIAELVDNAIDAIRSKDDPKGKVTVTVSDGKITVRDDGCGMTKDQLGDSMKLAKSSKIDKLGKFGLGLKTAALSLGSSFSMVTKSNSSKYAYSVSYDEESWGANNSKWEIEVDELDLGNIDSFTELEITKVKSKIPSVTVDKIRLDMGERYAPYIQSGDIVIELNGKKCLVQLPMIHPETKRNIEIPVYLENKQVGVIIGWVALLKEGSNKGNYGFTTYWRNRMITRYDKIAIGEHPTISRIIGEVHLDFLEPTHNKREFIKESPEYQQAELLLKDNLKDILSEAKKKSGDDTLTPQLQDKVEKFTEATLQVLNQSPEFRDFTSKLAMQSFKRTDEGEDQSGNLVEKRESPSDSEPNESGDHLPFRDARNPKQVHSALRKGIRIKGKYFKFVHSFQHLGSKEKMWSMNRNTDDEVIEVYTNLDFPAYSVSKDQSFYAFYNITDALAELFCTEVSGNTISEIRELILRKASDFITDNEE